MKDNLTTDPQRREDALSALDEIGATGCLFELGEHLETIKEALQDQSTDALLSVLNNIKAEALGIEAIKAPARALGSILCMVNEALSLPPVESEVAEAIKALEKSERVYHNKNEGEFLAVHALDVIKIKKALMKKRKKK